MTVGQKNQRRSGTGALQVGEDIARLLPVKSGANDDDVGCESGGLARRGDTLRRAPHHQKAGMTEQDVLDESLKRRGFHGDQDTEVLRAASPFRPHEALIDRHSDRLGQGFPAIDWGFALAGLGNAPRGEESHLVRTR